MAEYIDREELLELYETGNTVIDKVGVVPLQVIRQNIMDMPAADVAPVVRCKDCKHRYSDSWCEYVDDDDNFYCARGERKGGAD